MNKVAEVNQRELEANTSDEASWHFDYRDTAYIYIGNLPPISELDILRIFSQYGVPTHLHIVKDNQGQRRGFAFLKYQDVRSCVLAVDNFNGVKIQGRALRVDHTYYKLRKGDNEDNYLVDYDEIKAKHMEREKKQVKGKDKELRRIMAPSDETDDLADPMARFNNNAKSDNSKPEAKVSDMTDAVAQNSDDLTDPMAGYEESKPKTKRFRRERK